MAIRFVRSASIYTAHDPSRYGIREVGRVECNKIKVDVERFMLIFQIIKQSNFWFAPPTPTLVVSFYTPTN